MKKNAKNVKNKKILVVDDNCDFLEYMKDFLQTFNFECFTAKNVQDGLKEFYKVKPDIVISDLRMPDSSGDILVRYVKKLSKNVPIIIVTGYSDHYRILKALKWGAIELIKKPFKLDTLEYLVKRIETLTSMEKDDFHNTWEKVYIDYLEFCYENLQEEYQNFRSSSREDLIDTVKRFKETCGSIAHGLKNEFLHIGHAGKEIRELNGQQEEISEECDIIERSVAYSQVLLQRLMSYLEIKSPKREKVRISLLIRQIDLMVSPRLRSSIKFDILADQRVLKLEMLANSEQLMGILLELIENASNAMIAKGGTIKLIFEEKEKKVSITVKDDGPGIPKEIMKKLLIEQIPSEKGQGLGLYFCHKVVREFGGELVLSDSSKNGTTFTITIPTEDDKKD